MEQHRSHLYGVMGEFENAKHFLRAVAKVRDAGYRNMDAYAPFPVEGLSEAMGLRRSWVPLVTLLGGLGGGLTGFGFQYWVNVFAYPMNNTGHLRINDSRCRDFRCLRNAGHEQAAASLPSGF
jgi:hypothetical protein